MSAMANPAESRSRGGTRSIGQVLSVLRADFPEVSISKIRFLESEGLISPQRAPSGYRRYTDSDIEWLRYILSVQREHYVPLKVIRDHLQQIDKGLTPPSLGSSRSLSEAGEPGAAAEPPDVTEGMVPGITPAILEAVTASSRRIDLAGALDHLYDLLHDVVGYDRIAVYMSKGLSNSPAGVLTELEEVYRWDEDDRVTPNVVKSRESVNCLRHLERGEHGLQVDNVDPCFGEHRLQLADGLKYLPEVGDILLVDSIGGPEIPSDIKKTTHQWNSSSL